MKSLFLLILTFFILPLCAQQLGSKQQTLSFIKPDAVTAHHTGEILARFEKSGLRIAAIKMVWLTEKQGQTFYAVHKYRPFFSELIRYICSGPVIAMVLEGENAIAKTREIIGATDPKKADIGTIRRDFGESIEKNAVHGSDSIENAKQEISFFFSLSELVNLQSVM